MFVTDDCDFKNGIININNSLICILDEFTGKFRLYISTIKTESGEHGIPMFEAVREALLNERLR